MSRFFLSEHMPALMELLCPEDKEEAPATLGAYAILDAGYDFSRMLHASPASGGNADAFYRAFVPELGSALATGHLRPPHRPLVRVSPADPCS